MSNCVNVSWNDVEKFVSSCTSWVKSNVDVTGVYAVPRGGLVLGTMLSHSLDVPMLASPSKGCLIVDDISDTGKTLYGLSRRGTFTACMFYKKGSLVEPDFWMSEKVDSWIKFPWEVDGSSSKDCLNFTTSKTDNDLVKDYLYTVDWQEPGLTCIFSSALVSFWKGNLNAYLHWMENALRRMFLPVSWGYFSVDYFRVFPAESSVLVSKCVKAASEDDFYVPESHKYANLVKEIADKMRLWKTWKDLDGPRSFVSPSLANSDVPSFLQTCALGLRSYSLARHHETNSKLRDPDLDWKTFDNCVRKAGTSSDKEESVKEFAGYLLEFSEKNLNELSAL